MAVPIPNLSASSGVSSSDDFDFGSSFGDTGGGNRGINTGFSFQLDGTTAIVAGIAALIAVVALIAIARKG